MHCIRRSVLGITSTALIATSFVFSSVAGAQALEEVVVTARKRDESLLEIPVAITAFSAEQLDRGGFINLQDLSFQTAGLQFHKQGGQIPGRINTAVRFRGMDTNQSAASQQIGTVFLDGVYVSQGVASIDFSNIERVEVIKGPQSATFGRSTFAGAVNYVTRTPGEEYEGRISADFSDYGGRDVSLSHEGRLFEGMNYRVSARSYGTDGQYRSTSDGGRLGEEGTDTLSGVLYWEPSDNFSAKLRYMWSKDEDGPAAGMLMGTPVSWRGTGQADGGTNCFSSGQTAFLVGGVTSDYYCGALPSIDVDRFISTNTTLTPYEVGVFGASTWRDPRNNVLRNKIDGVPFVNYMGMKRIQKRAVLLLNYDFDQGALDGHSLSSTIGWSDMRAAWVRDFDLTGARNFNSQDPQKHEDSTFELRFVVFLCFAVI